MMTENKYSKTAIYLHWIIAVLMIVNVSLGWIADSLPDAWIRLTIDTHKSIGISVLCLVLMRVLWRIGHKPPALPDSFKVWEKNYPILDIGGLYLLMFLVPISGWLHDSAWKDAATHPMQLFYTIPWPRIAFIEHMEPVFKERLHDIFGEAHELMSTVLVALFVLHILGVLKHMVIDKQSIMSRMLP
jgi:cytochrome b561